MGVRFKRAGKIYYFDPAGHDLKPSDHVIVETARGVEYGEVVVGPKQVPEDEIVAPLKEVMRKATEEDALVVEENHRKEERAFEICQEKIAAHGLPMKLVDVEYTFDNNKIIFYFTAEGRVDFRELVRDLASVFRTRVELRQIGVRDEAKMIGGLGPCGRQLCCTLFLGDFEPVSIKMAKDQNLSLNPTKISGICGRLMCCLKFESDVYKDAKETTDSAAAGGNGCGVADDGCGSCPKFSVPDQAPGEAAAEPGEPQVPYTDAYGELSDTADGADASDEIAVAFEPVLGGALTLPCVREEEACEPHDSGAGELVGRSGQESERGPYPSEDPKKARGRRDKSGDSIKDAKTSPTQAKIAKELAGSAGEAGDVRTSKRKKRRRPKRAPGETAAGEGAKADAVGTVNPADAQVKGVQPETPKPKPRRGHGRRRGRRGGANRQSGNAGQTSTQEKQEGHVPKDHTSKDWGKGRRRQGPHAVQEDACEGGKPQAVDGEAAASKAAGATAPGQPAEHALDQAAQKPGMSGRGPRGRRGRGPRRDGESQGRDHAGQPAGHSSELIGK